MKYMGSKARIADQIVPIIQEFIDKNSITLYVEPFCGGCNVIDKIRCQKKEASDISNYLIELLKNLNHLSELPTVIDREHYSEVRDFFYGRNLSVFPDWYVGAVGFLASYNGRFFDGGYAGIVQTKTGIYRNYYDEAKRNLLKQSQNLKDVSFECGDYEILHSQKAGALIYCDIPYKGTKQYGINKNFDYDRFWNWAAVMSRSNIVLVSEHSAPDGWKCIWSQEVKRTINNRSHIDSIERLFIYDFEKEAKTGK